MLFERHPIEFSGSSAIARPFYHGYQASPLPEAKNQGMEMSLFPWVSKGYSPLVTVWIVSFREEKKIKKNIWTELNLHRIVFRHIYVCHLTRT